MHLHILYLWEHTFTCKLAECGIVYMYIALFLCIIIIKYKNASCSKNYKS